MNLDFSDWDQDVPAEGNEEYQTLLNAIKRKNNNEFGLLFVECTPLETEKLFSRILHDIPEKKLEILRLFEPVNTLYERVLNLYIHQQFDILFIKGLEYSIYKYEKEKFGEITETHAHDLSSVPTILDHLNKLRESFRDNIPITFVFLGRPFLIDYFIHRAQDFFDWKSANVLKLTTVPDFNPEESVSSSGRKSKISLSP
ncbi:hypothetical protein PN497_00720 [Sphaerospermopsis kisseleviana CS-549]|uniref:TPR repeat-containing protein n=1 Tax=Sphaerospermopsis kisseleviana CS-549 TaxID=3021783 RepID=A0ABT4ZKL5_9CYAN|nr:hypothetical protein [Sphaerospermopsis kisseleviana]MDB9439911.1 hypothetical protein [Sphaerospermopsis kisseleviana CS-549]BAZ79858.1 TPR repeat-containing protein [Sphaerospermopsis kisseleviana NIES-73]